MTVTILFSAHYHHHHHHHHNHRRRYRHHRRHHHHRRSCHHHCHHRHRLPVPLLCCGALRFCPGNSITLHFCSVTSSAPVPAEKECPHTRPCIRRIRHYRNVTPTTQRQSQVLLVICTAFRPATLVGVVPPHQSLRGACGGLLGPPRRSCWENSNPRQTAHASACALFSVRLLW